MYDLRWPRKTNNYVHLRILSRSLIIYTFTLTCERCVARASNYKRQFEIVAREIYN